MSGALVSLVAKGVQDAYITHNDGLSFFKMRYTHYKNFSQSPKQLSFESGKVENNGTSVIKIKSYGDLVNSMWLEGDDLIDNLKGTVFDLYIGGNLVDSQSFEFMSDIWQIYMAETYTKASQINNGFSKTNTKFLPLHFFFCDNGMFLPLVAIQYHEVEIRVRWGSQISGANNIKVFANYVFLDTDERELMTLKDMEI